MSHIRSLARLFLICAGLYVGGFGVGQSSQGGVYFEVWSTLRSPNGQMVFYSQAPTKAKADAVATALTMFPQKPKVEVRGPFRQAVQGAQPLAWGAKVTKEFRDKVRTIAKNLSVDPDYLMAIMAFETGESFDPAKKNGAGSGATGLIQFMPATAKALGTTTDALAKMTAVDQLDYVAAYFKPDAGKLTTLEDAYMAVLYPRAIGQANDFVLFKKGTVAYTQNAGLDADGNGEITKAEAAARVRAELTRGQQPGFSQSD